MILHDKIYRNTTMPDYAKISGYIPEAVAKMLKAFDGHPVEDSWRKHRKIEELEYYQWEITWLSKSHAVDLPGDVITSICCTKRCARTVQKVTITQWEKRPIFTTFCERALFLWKTLTASRNWSLTLNALSQVDLVWIFKKRDLRKVNCPLH